MSEQNSGSNRPQSSGGGQNNNNRRHHHNRNRRPQGQNPAGQQQGGSQGQRPQGQQQGQQARSGGPQQGGSGNPHRRRHRGGQNRHRSQGQGAQGQGQGQAQQHPHGINLERLYEKYLNLLDQHLIARRKYHDMFYRADNAQKAKLERNFYNTLNDVREFENKMTPEARELFEKRNNGLKPDTIYTSNHEIAETEVVISEGEVEDPHFLQSQRAADYSGDTEESVGTLDDYLRYKNLV